MSSIQKLAASLGRLLLSLVFLLSGVGKMNNYAGIQGFMESVGLPEMFLPLAKAISTPAYMLASNLTEAQAGMASLVKKMVSIL